MRWVKILNSKFPLKTYWQIKSTMFHSKNLQINRFLRELSQWSTYFFRTASRVCLAFHLIASWHERHTYTRIIHFYWLYPTGCLGQSTYISFYDVHMHKLADYYSAFYLRFYEKDERESEREEKEQKGSEMKNIMLCYFSRHNPLIL